MFFDEVNQKDDFSEAMIDIAKLLNTLFRLRYDEEKRLPRVLEIRKRGLFNRELILPSSYAEVEQLLKEKQSFLTKKRIQAGYSDDIFWWKFPSEQVIPYLLECLSFPEEEGEPDWKGWRRAFAFFEEDGIEGRRMIGMRMRAHHQNVVSSKYRTEIEHSAYTKQEREAMADAYNRKKNEKALLHMTFSNNTGVYSIASGQEYKTAADYYASSEYVSNRLRQDLEYRESLYTVEKRDTLRVRSQSFDRISAHGLCEFHVDASGTLDYMATMDFVELYGPDSSRDEMEELLGEKDAMLIGALLLAENEDVRRVPLSLFDRGYNLNNYTELMRLAGIMTCLAPKLGRSL